MTNFSIFKKFLASYKLKSLISYLSRYSIFLWLAYLLIITGFRLSYVIRNWQNAKGAEYFWIAQGIAAGQGFSIDADHRWFFMNPELSYPTDEYFSTAIEEPIYPYIMAFALRTFGEHGKLAILVFQIIALLATCIVVYYLGRKVFSAWVGILASSMLISYSAIDHLAQENFGLPILAGLIISLSCLVIIWCLQKASVFRGIILGLLLGLFALTYSVAMLFIPLSVLLVLFSPRLFQVVKGKTALAIILTACLTISPWTYRNYQVFGHFVPVRTGMGLNFHHGNPILAGTITGGNYACSNTFGSLWQASNAREAILLSKQGSKYTHPIFQRSYDCLEQEVPDGYENFNEVERDKVYMQKSVEFILAEPQTFIALAYNKFLGLYEGWSPSPKKIAILAFMGSLLAIRKPKARILVMMIAIFSVPYSLAVSWWYRYRYPIEPILLILASYVLVFITTKLKQIVTQSR